MIDSILALINCRSTRIGKTEEKSRKEFQEFILRALREMTIREVAELAKTSLPTVRRWATGETHPVTSFRKHIINHMTPEVVRRENAIYDKYFGGRQKPQE